MAQKRVAAGGLDAGALGTLPRNLLADVAYLHVRLAGAWAPTKAWVALLHDLEVMPGTTRAALQRLDRGGFLQREQRSGQAGYALTGAWLEVMDRADATWQRLLQAPPSLSEGWTIVSFSIPEADRAGRHQLRAVLTRMGFGNIGAGTWVGPAWRADTARRLIELLGFAGEVDVFVGAYIGIGSVETMVGRAWRLDDLAVAYQDVVDTCEALLRRKWRFPDMGREAYIELTRLAFDLRASLDRDPGLPLEVAPNGWAGWRARRLAASVADALHGPALDYVDAVIGVAPKQIRRPSPFAAQPALETGHGA